jgi:S-adenosylmethionine synthetase
MRDFTVTSLSVTPGHPDKLCDHVSDAVVDAFRRLDPGARVEVESAVAAGILFVACYTSSPERPDLGSLAREVVREAGYRDGDFDADQVPVMVSVTDLGSDHVTARGTDPERVVATRNVTTFGYASERDPLGLPLPVALAHGLARELGALGRSGDRARRPGPDAQVQVTVRYQDRRPVAVEAVTVLAQLAGGDDGPLATRIEEDLVGAALARLPDVDTGAARIWINPEGVPVPGGPAHHAGLTGRKLGVDTYGDFCRQPSAALSGKGLERIDRTATYAARHLARNLVAAGLAHECEIQLCYTIGRVGPAGVDVDSFGTGVLPDRELGRLLAERVDLRPGAIRARFDVEGLRLAPLVVFGQLGRPDLELPWERTELVASLRR